MFGLIVFLERSSRDADVNQLDKSTLELCTCLLIDYKLYTRTANHDYFHNHQLF